LPAHEQESTMANILMIVTSAGQMRDGSSTGLWLEEFAVPYAVLRDSNHTLTVASPKGGDTPIDPRSTSDVDQHPQWQDAAQHLQQTHPLEGLQADDYDAVFIAGGHGTMFDFPDNALLGGLLADLHALGRPIAAVCHGPAAFVGVRRSDGKPLVEGYHLTAFSDAEEQAVGLADAVPFLLSSRLQELGANVENGPPMRSHVLQDRQLITGQNPASSRDAATLLLGAIGQGRTFRPSAPMGSLGVRGAPR
jgi:putative intracellular protease/amidase